MKYPFNTVHFNGRDVRITEILNGSASPASPFESASFAFISNWLGEAEVFRQQTSGSTGAPKIILISRTAMISSAKMTQQALQLEEGNSALLCLDPNYIAGKMMIVRAFVTGMKLLAVEPSLNPLDKSNLRQQFIDFTALIPAQLTAILASDSQYMLDQFKNIIVGGAPMNEQMVSLVAGYTARIFATYGMTETVSHIALQHVNGPSASEYFKVLPGVSIHTDERGCLQIKTPFLEDLVTTNDIVEIKNGDEFKWIGRSDNVINTGGVKIVPEKLEAEIQNVFTVLLAENRFIISSVPDTVFGEKLILLIEGSLPTSVENLKSSLQEALPRNLVPKHIVENATLVTTENGKINRNETKTQNGILHFR
jgi:o-succinylbenzoate---CoA ligase